MKKIIAILLLFSMIFCVSCRKKPEPTVEEKVETKVEKEEESEAPISTYVFFGSDTRDSSQKGRSDVIMLATIDNETKSIKLVSVYRDTLMDDNGLNKCNAAYSYGGAEEAMDMLERNLDLSIDGYVSADFLAVIDAIDAVGGIDLNITGEEAHFANSYIKAMNELYDKNSPDLIEGEQHLDEGWDYKRTERQRTVLELLAEKMKALPEEERTQILLKLITEMKTDLDQSQISDVVNGAINYDITESCGFPEYKAGKSFDDLGDCIIPTDLVKNVKWLHEKLYNEEDYTPSEEVEKINSMINNIAN